MSSGNAAEYVDDEHDGQAKGETNRKMIVGFCCATHATEKHQQSSAYRLGEKNG